MKTPKMRATAKLEREVNKEIEKKDCSIAEIIKKTDENSKRDD